MEAALASSQAALAEERGKRARIASRQVWTASETAAARSAAAHKTEVRRLQEGAREQQKALEAARGRLARAAEHERSLQQQLQVAGGCSGGMGLS